MQEKVRAELTKKLEEAEKERNDKVAQIKKMEEDMKQRETTIHLERVNQQEMIDELNGKVEELAHRKSQLERESV